MNNKEKLYLAKVAGAMAGVEGDGLGPAQPRSTLNKRTDSENSKLLEEADMQKLPRKRIPVMDSKIFNSISRGDRNAFRQQQLKAIDYNQRRNSFRTAVDANATKPTVK